MGAQKEGNRRQRRRHHRPSKAKAIRHRVNDATRAGAAVRAQPTRGEELIPRSGAVANRESVARRRRATVLFLVKPSSYSRTPYTDGRGDDGKNTKAEARGLRAQPRAARVQHTQAQAET